MIIKNMFIQKLLACIFMGRNFLANKMNLGHGMRLRTGCDVCTLARFLFLLALAGSAGAYNFQATVDNVVVDEIFTGEEVKFKWEFDSYNGGQGSVRICKIPPGSYICTALNPEFEKWVINEVGVPNFDCWFINSAETEIDCAVSDDVPDNWDSGTDLMAWLIVNWNPADNLMAWDYHSAGNYFDKIGWNIGEKLPYLNSVNPLNSDLVNTFEVSNSTPGTYKYILTPCSWVGAVTVGIPNEYWQQGFFTGIITPASCTASTASSDSIEISIEVKNRLPIISNFEITNLAEAYDGSANIQLGATVIDPEGLAVSVDFAYKVSGSTTIVSIDSSISGSDAEGVLNNPPSGNEAITFYLRAQDNYMGSEWTDWTEGPTIVVNDPPPVPQIIEPAKVTYFSFTDLITFSAIIPDVDGGAIVDDGYISDVQFCYALSSAADAELVCFATLHIAELPEIELVSVACLPDCIYMIFAPRLPGEYSVSRQWQSIVPNQGHGPTDYYIHVIATDNNGASSQTDMPTLITISNNETPDVSMKSPNNGEEFFAQDYDPQGILLAAAASDPDGDVIQSVTFIVEGESIGNGTLNSGNGYYEATWYPAANAGSDYQIYALAKDGLDLEHPSAEITISLLSDPTPPELMINGSTAPADTESPNLNLSWSSINSANLGYRLWDVLSNTVVFEFDRLAMSGTYPVQSSGTYRYKLQACGNLVTGGEICSDYSNEVEVTVAMPLPAAPALSLSLPEINDQTATENYGDYELNWQANPSSDEVIRYEVQQKLGALDSGQPWVDIVRSNGLSTVESFFDQPVSEYGSYSYQARACNVYQECGEWGTQITTQVLSPWLNQAQLECDENCIQLSGIALDPEGTVTLTAIHNNALLGTYSGAQGQLSWTSLHDFSVDISATSVRSALFDQMGIVIKFSNPNGATFSITMSGDDANSYVNLIESSPIEYNGIIYVGVGNDLHALLQETGKEVLGWPFTTGGEIKSTPAIDHNDGAILVGSADDYLYAVHTAGNQKWAFLTGGDIVSSPVLDIDEEGRTLAFVGSMDGNLYAIDAEDGSAVWLLPVGAPIADSPVTAGGGWIYVTNQDGYIQAVGRGALGSDVLVWESQDDSLLTEDWNLDNWIPFGTLETDFARIVRVFDLLVQPPLNYDREIITFWTYALTLRVGIEEIVDAFLNSDTGLGEFPLSLSDSEFIDLLYERAFFNYDGSEPPIHYAGVEYVTADLLTLLGDGASRATVAMLFAGSEEYVDATKNTSELLFDLFYVQNFDWVPIPADCPEDEIQEEDLVRDCDKDLLPDYWEIIHFGDLVSQRGEASGDSSGGASWDADGDGDSNYDAWNGNEHPCASECLDVEVPPAPLVGVVPPVDTDSESIGLDESEKHW